jgi:peptide deformylase
VSVREVVAIGDPLLRERSRELDPTEIASPEVQTLIDDLIETKRATYGAGIAANQVGEPLRVASRWRRGIHAIRTSRRNRSR